MHQRWHEHQGTSHRGAHRLVFSEDPMYASAIQTDGFAGKAIASWKESSRTADKLLRPYLRRSPTPRRPLRQPLQPAGLWKPRCRRRSSRPGSPGGAGMAASSGRQPERSDQVKFACLAILHESFVNVARLVKDGRFECHGPASVFEELSSKRRGRKRVSFLCITSESPFQPLAWCIYTLS